MWVQVFLVLIGALRRVTSRFAQLSRARFKPTGRAEKNGNAGICRETKTVPYFVGKKSSCQLTAASKKFAGKVWFHLLHKIYQFKHFPWFPSISIHFQKLPRPRFSWIFTIWKLYKDFKDWWKLWPFLMKRKHKNQVPDEDSKNLYSAKKALWQQFFKIKVLSMLRGTFLLHHLKPTPTCII